VSRLDVCARTPETIRRDGGSFCKVCGWSDQEHAVVSAQVRSLKAELDNMTELRAGTQRHCTALEQEIRSLRADLELANAALARRLGP
jgi:hypothetical protein